MKTKIIVPIVTLMLLASAATKANDSLELTSPAFADKGQLPVQFTCDGDGISPPLTWSGVPDGTESLVVIMDNKLDPRRAVNKDNKQKWIMVSNDSDGIPTPLSKKVSPITTYKDNKQNNRKVSHDNDALPTPYSTEELRWYWGMYNIPAQDFAITSGQSVGTLGSNVVNNLNEYTPPCSKGAGQRDYSFHIYALSDSISVTQSDNVSEDVLLEKMSGLVLDSDSLTVSFERTCQTTLKSDSKQNIQKQGKSDLPPCEIAMVVSK